MALSDGQLLERFASRREETAFETLLARHGPMVWGVCLRALGHRQEAEDAFQATFLVLARRASAIRRREAIGGWLHAVARRLALKLKLADHARRAREQAAIDQAAVVRGPDDLLTQVVWREIRTVLDEELGQLPEKYRAPLVLCYLEGKTHQEAAAELGWPSGSMSKRVARACELLRERLTRRGLAFSTALVAGALSDHGAAAVPPALATSTLRAATACITGKMAGAIAAPVVALTEGVLAAMFLTKIKIAAAVLVATGLGIGLVSYGALAGGQQPVPGAVPVPKEDPSAIPLVIRDQGKSEADEKKGSPGPFITEIIDPQAKHTLTFPPGYGCILVLRERPIRWSAVGSSGIAHLEPVGRSKQFLLRTGAGGTAVIYFWFDNPQRWNFQEDVFILTIRVDDRLRPTTKPIDPASFKDVPVISSIVPPQGELTIGRNGTRLLILKETLHAFEPRQSQVLQVLQVAPKQLLLTATDRTDLALPHTQLLTLWSPANAEPEQVEIVNYLVHIVDESKVQQIPSDQGPAARPPPARGGGSPARPQAQPLARLAEARRDAAMEGYRYLQKEMPQGKVSVEALLPWLRRMLESDLEVAKDKAGRVKAYEDYLQHLKDCVTVMQARYQAGQVSRAAMLEASYLATEAELWLAREKEKP